MNEDTNNILESQLQHSDETAKVTHTLLENNIEASVKTANAVESLKPLLEKLAEPDEVPEAGEHEIQVIKIKGDKGEKGDKGDKGDEGKAGPEGKQGPKGDNGEDGKEGPEGKEGRVGPMGAQGPQGEQGKPGAVGKKGDKGEKGDDGSADTGTEIVAKINAGEDQIDASKIKGALPRNGSSKTDAISELGDVNLLGMADGDSLQWDATTGKWIPKYKATAVGFHTITVASVAPSSPQLNDIWIRTP